MATTPNSVLAIDIHPNNFSFFILFYFYPHEIAKSVNQKQWF